MEVIEESSTQHGQSDDSDEEHKDKNNPQTVNPKVEVGKPKIVKRVRPAPLEVLNKVHLNNTLETPRSTIKGLMNYPTHIELNFSRKNLKKVEEQLQRAFVEFYRKLRLLKS